MAAERLLVCPGFIVSNAVWRLSSSGPRWRPSLIKGLAECHRRVVMRWGSMGFTGGYAYVSYPTLSCRGSPMEP